MYLTSPDAPPLEVAVKTVVDADGSVESATIWKSSQIPAADAAVIAAAKVQLAKGETTCALAFRITGLTDCTIIIRTDSNSSVFGLSRLRCRDGPFCLR